MKIIINLCNYDLTYNSDRFTLLTDVEHSSEIILTGNVSANRLAETIWYFRMLRKKYNKCFKVYYNNI